MSGTFYNHSENSALIRNAGVQSSKLLPLIARLLALGEYRAQK